MKQFTCTFILLVLWQTAFSQTNNFAPLGATWYFRDIDGEVNYPPYNTYGYNKIESITDTLIDGILCHKLLSTFVNSTGETTRVESYYTYEDSNKVYFYNEDRFKLLYDFSGANWYAHDVFYGIGDSILQIVDSVKYESIGDELYKVIYLYWEPGTPFSFPGNRIVERLGSTSYLFLLDALDDTYPPLGLRCYQDSLFNFIADSTIACDTLIPEIVDIQSNNVSHFNVFHQGCNLHVTGIKTLTTIHLLSPAGQRLLEVETYGDISIQIDHIPKGFYILLLETGDNMYAQKITLQ